MPFLGRWRVSQPHWFSHKVSGVWPSSVGWVVTVSTITTHTVKGKWFQGCRDVLSFEVMGYFPYGARLGAFIQIVILTFCRTGGCWVILPLFVIKALLCLNSFINKAGPTGPGFVSSELQHRLRAGQHGWLRKKVHGELTLMTFMSISPGSQWRRD